MLTELKDTIDKYKREPTPDYTSRCHISSVLIIPIQSSRDSNWHVTINQNYTNVRCSLIQCLFEGSEKLSHKTGFAFLTQAPKT